MQNVADNNKRIARNTFFLYVRMILVLCVSLYTTRVVLNVLGVTDYGIYNVVAGFVSLFAFLNSTMTIGIQRFYNYVICSKESIYTQKDVYNTALTVQIIISCIVLLLLETIGIWYICNVMVFPPERFYATMFVFQCSSISLVFVIMQVPFSAAIMANERMDYYAAISILDVLLKLAIVLLLPYVHFDHLIFYGFLSLTISIADFLCYIIYCRIQFQDIRYDSSRNTVLLKQMLTFSGWNILDMFAYTIKVQGLNMLLNGFFGPLINAARGIAAQILGALTGFSSNVVTAFRPQLVGSYAQGDYKRTTTLMFSMSKISFGLLYVISLPIFLEIDYVLYVWLDGNVPQYTSVFTQLVLADMLVNSLNTPLSQVVQAVGQLKTYQIVRSIVVLLILPISWMSLKLGANPTVVFIIGIVISIINQYVSMYLLHRIYDYKYTDYLHCVLFPCILLIIFSMPIPIIIKQYLVQGNYRFLIVAVASVSICVLLSYRFLLSIEQRKDLWRIVKCKIRK